MIRLPTQQFQAKHYAIQFYSYVVENKLEFGMRATPDIQQWCDKQFPGQWRLEWTYTNPGYFVFDNDEDASAFVIQFG